VSHVTTRRVLLALVTPFATLGLAAPALAAGHHPTGEYAPYVDCPSSNPSLMFCLVADTTSGELPVGKKAVPINRTITLQGGTILNSETGALTFVGAENGETLSKIALNVPGGLFGAKPPESWPKEAKERFEEMINKGSTGVTATTELAKPASDIGINTNNLLDEEGLALSLPVKVKLSNFLLGSSCYVGSEADPIVLNLTTGTTSPPEPNKPINGKVGEVEFKEELDIVHLLGGSLVDNSFAAPEASGCGGSLSKLIDPIVDAQFGLPAAAGHNAAILNGNLEEAVAEAVKASE
jgi:hypothetical protein